MGLFQQEWVGQSRGKMPLPLLPIETRHLARGSGVPPRFSLNRAKMALPRVAKL